MIDLNCINFDKSAGLIPAIIQDNATMQVLMLGYMNREAIEKTIAQNRVTFYSRTKQRLWTKGETSNNFLNVVSIKADCDNDTLLIRVVPQGPACHKGTTTCFGENNNEGFLGYLQSFIKERKRLMPENSYTTKLFSGHIAKIAQKVGEEAVETVIEAVKGDDKLMLYEASDLMYHLIVLLVAKGYDLSDIENELATRH